MTHFRFLAIGAALLTVVFTVGGGCGIGTPKASLSLRLTGPTFPSGFSCVAVVITGENIPTSDSSIKADWQKIYDGRQCPYPGISTELKAVPTSGEATFSLTVPAGQKNTIQVMGLSTSDSTCPKYTLNELLVLDAKKALPSTVSGIYELGRSTQSLLKSKAVDVAQTYNAQTSEDLRGCAQTSSGSGGGVTLPFSSLTLFVNDVYQFQPSGGSGQYTYQVGAALGAFTGPGRYVASAIPGIGTITVTDSGGTQVTIGLTVLNPPGMGNLKYWFNSRFYSSSGDGANVNPGDNWTSAGTDPLALLVSPPTRPSNIRYLETAGPMGFPTVDIPTSGVFNTGSGATISGGFSAFIVARRTQASAVDLFCLGGTPPDCGTSGQFILLRFPTAAMSAGLKVTSAISSVGTGAAAADPLGWFITESKFTVPSGNISAKHAGGILDTVGHFLSIFSPSGNFILGSSNSTAGASMDLQIAELLVFEDVDSNTVVIGQALRDKYQLP